MILIERQGSVEIKQSDVEGLDLDGRVLAIVPKQDSFVISVEMEEDLDVEFESAETD